MIASLKNLREEKDMEILNLQRESTLVLLIIFIK